MSEERLAVLRMLQEGKVSAEEALRLLDTLQETSTAGKGRPGGPAAFEAPQGKGPAGARMLRVRVYDDGEPVVNVNVPLQVARLAMKFIPKGYLEHAGVDVDDILEAIRQGAEGKIVEVRDKDDDSGVEVSID